MTHNIKLLIKCIHFYYFFFQGILDLKIKAFTYLTQHNITLWLYEVFVFYHDRILENFKNRFEEKQKRIEYEWKKVSFLEERNYLLKYDAHQITKKPLAKCLKKLVIIFINTKLFKHDIHHD